METIDQKCQICKKRNAKKRLSTQWDEGYFFVCGKKKCLSALYDILHASNSPSKETKEEFVAKNSHDPMDWQGRDYENVEGTELIIFWVIVAGFGTILGIAIFNVFY
jgi:hypothetical protein